MKKTRTTSFWLAQVIVLFLTLGGMLHAAVPVVITALTKHINSHPAA